MSNDKKPSNIFSNLFSDNSSNTSVNKSIELESSIISSDSIINIESEESISTQSKPKDVRTIQVNISGVTYPINCPVNEKEDLEKAVLYINHFIREIRKDAPTLTHENLLVLCCLNMYEEMKQQKNTQASIRANDKQMKTLIEKITQDAKSILP